MDDKPSIVTRVVFGASVLATVVGLVIIFDPESIIGYLGWDEEVSAASVYTRGLLLVCAGCWFGMRTWRSLAGSIDRRAAARDPAPRQAADDDE